MDKWKDTELDKMKVGSNRKARIFFESQEDYHDGMSIHEKYNSKAAALYRDKVIIIVLPKVFLAEGPRMLYSAILDRPTL